jgi:hypothetical protein
MGTRLLTTSISNLKKKYKLSDKELSGEKNSNSYSDKIEKEETEKFGWVVRIPCRHCGELNFLSKK